MCALVGEHAPLMLQNQHHPLMLSPQPQHCKQCTCPFLLAGMLHLRMTQILSLCRGSTTLVGRAVPAMSTLQVPCCVEEGSLTL